MSKDKHYKGNTREYTLEYTEWRRLVFDRDGSKCVKCGSFKKLHAHHIQSWKNYPEKRFVVSNGETLCYCCHVEVHPFMIKYDKKNIKRKAAKAKKLKQRQAFNKKKRKKKRKLKNKSGNTRSYENHRFNKDNPNPNWT